MLALGDAALGLPTCWDQWFPEVARAYCLAGADVARLPDRDRLRARPPRLRHRAALGAGDRRQRRSPTAPSWSPSTASAPSRRCTFYGSSFVSDPYGRVLVQAPRDEPAVLVADLDLDQRRDWLELFPLLSTRRPDTYAPLDGPVRGRTRFRSSLVPLVGGTNDERIVWLRSSPRPSTGWYRAAQLQGRGFSRKLISAEAAGHRWRRVHRGVYAVGHEALSWNGQCMAAVLANAPAVASHWTAAWLWGLLRSSPDGMFHLTAPSRRHRRRGFVVHFAALEPGDVGEVEEVPGIPLTSLARTHLDVAAVEPGRLDAFLERSEELKLFDLREFDSLLARSAHHPGRGALTKALRTYRPDPAMTRSKSRSDFEPCSGAPVCRCPPRTTWSVPTSSTAGGRRSASASNSTPSPPMARAAPSRKTASASGCCAGRRSR